MLGTVSVRCEAGVSDDYLYRVVVDSSEALTGLNLRGCRQRRCLGRSFGSVRGVYVAGGLIGDRNDNGVGLDICPQAYHPDGTPNGEESVGNATLISSQSRPSIAMTPAGRSLVTRGRTNGSSTEGDSCRRRSSTDGAVLVEGTAMQRRHVPANAGQRNQRR